MELETKRGNVPYNNFRTPSNRKDITDSSSGQQVQLDRQVLQRQETKLEDDIALRYRADRINVDVQDSDTMEAKVWWYVERIFCFLQNATIYDVRRRLKFVIIWQAIFCTIRFLPIILGFSYQSTVPVFVLLMTLIFGWHGTQFLAPKFLLFYKIGMQISLIIDIIWYALQWNGSWGADEESSVSVSGGTAFYGQVLISGVIFLLNLCGILYGFKLRRIVKSVQNKREFEQAAFATSGPESGNTNQADDVDEDEEHPLPNGVERSPSKVGSNATDQNQNSNNNKSVTASTKQPGEKKVTERNVVLNITNSSPAKEIFSVNTIRTSKYTAWNFLFVFFKIQFSRLANVYTCVVVALCFFNFSPVSPAASLTPLLIVFASAAAKDFTEDIRRKKSDNKVNSKPARIMRLQPTSKSVQEIPDASWKDVRVGDVLVLKNGDDVPADCLLLATSRTDGMCYVETANLDGETNLKIRRVCTLTQQISDVKAFLSANQLAITCDLPNRNMFEFNGYVKLHAISQKENGSFTTRNGNTIDCDKDIESSEVLSSIESGEPVMNQVSVTMDNIILRGCEMRSSDWTFAVALYTGPDTKIALNASNVQMKRTLVERTLDSMFVLVMLVLFTISVSCTLGNNDWKFVIDSNTMSTTTNAFWNSKSNDDYIFLSYVILFNNLIPLSMYVTMEGVRFVHARYIENDLEMYDAPSDTPAEARNSNINEDLGQVKYIFSDKTGTLTRNEMVFAKCTIAGLKYNDLEIDIETPQRAGTRFNDARLLNRLNVNHSTQYEIREFLTLLMICNTTIPEPDVENGGGVRYQASSPDEQALVLAARDLNFALESRSGSFCYCTIQSIPYTFEVLQVLEFSSDRKRMSVIVRHPDGSIRLYCKGADDVIFERLSSTQPQGVIHVTRGHLQEYAAQGLRTLTTAMRVISETDYAEWKKIYNDAEFSIENRNANIAAASELIECDLMLLGATAIEDLLQEGVEESICSLRKAGINFWVLTGDKKETAISVGMSSQVIDDSMDVIVLDKRNKALLTSKLEELYLHLVENKWGTSKDDSVSGVVYLTIRRICSMIYHHIINALSGRYHGEDHPERKRHRHRMRFNENASPISSSYNDTRNDTSEINWEVYPSSDCSINSNNNYMNQPIHHPDDDANSTSTTRCLNRNTSYCAKEFEAQQNEMINIENSNEVDINYAMVIDGRTLAMVLENDIKYLFLAVATQCKSVICCRCSPAQKAAVVRLVTEPTLLWTSGNISLAIGDGANDVPMIQAASVGVGISGKEGRQAVLSSDYSIAQFRFLKRLLLVHGNYSYKRISKLILFSFMKNIALSLSNFFFAPVSQYSGLLMYFSILFTLYNALFTTIPIVVIAMYNQDVNPPVLMQYPTLYRNGLDSRSFNWTSFLGWCALGVWHAYIVFIVPFSLDGYYRNFFISGDDLDAYLYSTESLGIWADGVSAYTCLIVASTFQVSLLTSNWAKPNVIAVVGTLSFYFVFIWFFCSLFEWTGGDFYETGIAANVFHELAKQPWFWLGMIFSGVAAVLPNYILKAGRVLFYPEPSHLMREWNKIPLEVEEVHQSSPRLVRKQTGFAFSYGNATSSNGMNRTTESI